MCLKRQAFSLKGRSNFKNFSDDSSKSFNTSFFVLIIKPNNNNNFKFGIVVTRKFGSAVKRNLLKRKIRTIFREIPKYYAGQSYDFLIIMRKKSSDMDCSVIQSELDKKIKQILCH